MGRNKGWAGAWCAAKSDRDGDFVSVTFLKPTTVGGVITQGRSDTTQWVTSYKVGYFEGVGGNVKYVVDETNKPIVFNGNTDSNTPVQNDFSPITARVVRIYPVDHYGWISMRFEVMECPCSSEKAGIENGE